MQISCQSWAALPQIGEGHSEDERLLSRRWGGKAANLDRLKRAGFPVPPGFVVPVDAFQSVLASGYEADLLRLAGLLETGRLRSPAAVREECPELVPLLDELRRPLGAALESAALTDCWLAVRSSGTLEDGLVASYAGVLESFLGVQGKELSEAVVLCWASALTRRCRDYSEATGIDPDDMAVAVIVQPVLPGVASGIVHTRDPLTGEAGIVIEAVRGLNHVACDGQTSPERLRRRRFGFERTPGEQAWQEVLTVSGIRRLVIPEAVRNTPVLSPSQRRELAALTARVEKLFGTPQDVEWTLAQDRLWLLQSRPVTAAASSRVWTRANLRELYPEVVTPFTGSLIRGLQQSWYVDYFVRLGFEVRHLGSGMRVIRGRPYLNLSLLRSLAEAAGVDGSRVEANIGSEAALPAEKSAANWRRALRTGLPLLRITGRYLRAETTSRQTLDRTYHFVDEMDRPDLEGLTDEAVLEGAVSCFRKLQPLYDGTADVAGAIEMLDILTQAVPGLTARVQSAVARTEARASSLEVHAFSQLIRIAGEEPEVRRRFLNGSGPATPEAFAGTRFGKALEQYLAEYGYRALYESDSGVPRYAEDPQPLLAAIQASLKAGKIPAAAGAAPVAAEPWKSGAGAAGLLAEPLRSIRERLLTRRQEIRQCTSRLIAAERRWERALARRWTSRGWIGRDEDFWWLTLDDIEAVLRNPVLGPTWLRGRVERRRARGAEWATSGMPIYWPPAAAATPSPAAEEQVQRQVLRGIPVSPGVVEGKVKLVLRPEDALDLEPDCILVAPFAGPAWTPFFASARGLVVELGGALSHSSILAREYGLPAVANVPDVTRRIRDGDFIRIDGSRGLVWQLDPPAVEGELENVTVLRDRPLQSPRRRRAGEARPGQELEWAHREAA